MSDCWCEPFDRADDASKALETEIACEVGSASTASGHLTYEWGGRLFRVGLELTEEDTDADS